MKYDRTKIKDSVKACLMGVNKRHYRFSKNSDCKWNAYLQKEIVEVISSKEVVTKSGESRDEVVCVTKDGDIKTYWVQKS